MVQPGTEGSQSVLAAIPENRLPEEAIGSIEVDIAFFDDTADGKADLVDGAIGELSPFHETFGYYAQGVSVSTAVLPRGWRDRVVVLETASTARGGSYRLEPHDCVVSKLVAGREKDYAFADALAQENSSIPQSSEPERILSISIRWSRPESAHGSAGTVRASDASSHRALAIIDGSGGVT
jgi:hypothetical protein